MRRLSMPRGVATKATSWRSARRTGSGGGPLAGPRSGAPSAVIAGLLGRAIVAIRIEGHDLGEQRALEVAEIERFLDEVVGAKIQGLQGLIVVGVAADHDDRCLGRLLAQALERLDAVHSGHRDVQQYDLGPDDSGHLQRLPAVLGPLHGVAVVGQKFNQHLTDRGFVVYHENLGHSSPRVRAGFSPSARPRAFRSFSSTDDRTQSTAVRSGRNCRRLTGTLSASRARKRTANSSPRWSHIAGKARTIIWATAVDGLSSCTRLRGA